MRVEVERSWRVGSTYAVLDRICPQCNDFTAPFAIVLFVLPAGQREPHSASLHRDYGEQGGRIVAEKLSQGMINAKVKAVRSRTD